MFRKAWDWPGSFIRPNECLGLCLRVLKQLSQKSKSSQLRHLNLGPFIGNIWHPSHLKSQEWLLGCYPNVNLSPSTYYIACHHTWHQDARWALAPSLTAVPSSVIAEKNLRSHPSRWHWKLDTHMSIKPRQRQSCHIVLSFIAIMSYVIWSHLWPHPHSCEWQIPTCTLEL